MTVSNVPSDKCTRIAVANGKAWTPSLCNSTYQFFCERSKVRKSLLLFLFLFLFIFLFLCFLFLSLSLEPRAGVKDMAWAEVSILCRPEPPWLLPCAAGLLFHLQTQINFYLSLKFFFCLNLAMHSGTTPNPHSTHSKYFTDVKYWLIHLEICEMM